MCSEAGPSRSGTPGIKDKKGIRPSGQIPFFTRSCELAFLRAHLGAAHFGFTHFGLAHLATHLGLAHL